MFIGISDKSDFLLLYDALLRISKSTFTFCRPLTKLRQTLIKILVIILRVDLRKI